jgi:hypothetical protein
MYLWMEELEVLAFLTALLRLLLGLGSAFLLAVDDETGP